MTALSVVFLYFSSVFPTGQAGFVGATVIFGAAAVISTGLKGGLSVFAASAVLGLFLLPDKSGLLMYVLFFGYYPVLKAVAERSRSRVIEWIIKLLPMELALFVLARIIRLVAFLLAGVWYGMAALFIVAAAVLVIFDIGVTKIITWLSRNMPRLLGKR